MALALTPQVKYWALLALAFVTAVASWPLIPRPTGPGARLEMLLLLLTTMLLLVGALVVHSLGQLADALQSPTDDGTMN